MKSLIIVLGIFCYSLASAQLIPGTVKKSIHVDSQKVSNQDWAAFMKFIKKDPGFSKAYVQSMIPDQWKITKINSQNKDLEVTGVSWKQAMEYCEWKSEVSTYLNSHTKLANYSQMKIDNKIAKAIITYRLPTGNEYAGFTHNVKGGTGFRCVYSIQKAS